MANVDVIMPQMGESITEGTLVKWLKKEGESVGRDEALFEISTEKVDVEIPSPASGVLQSIQVKEGETVPVNTIVAVIAREGEAAATAPAADASAAPAAEATAPAPAPTAGAEVVTMESRRPAEPLPTSKDELRKVRSSPLVRKIAREHSIDLTQVPGTGMGGRVTKADIMAFIERPAPTAVVSPATAPAPMPVVAAPAPPMVGQVQPISTMRKKIAEHMVFSRRTSAHVSTVFEVDMSKLVALRARRKAEFEARGAKLTYTALIAKAAVRSLQEYPVLNASIDGDDVVYHEHVNLGIAVALDDGLIVPVIHAAEEKNVLGLQRAINDLAERSRTRKLQPQEVQGGTFTITNPGIYGGMFGLPIINQPQVAILGVGGFEKRPVVIDDAIAIRTMSYLSLSFDHRIIDGAVADQFMAYLKQLITGMEDVD